MRGKLAKGVDQDNHCWSSHLVKHICPDFTTIYRTFGLLQPVFLIVFLLLIFCATGSRSAWW